MVFWEYIQTKAFLTHVNALEGDLSYKQGEIIPFVDGSASYSYPSAYLNGLMNQVAMMDEAGDYVHQTRIFI